MNYIRLDSTEHISKVVTKETVTKFSELFIETFMQFLKEMSEKDLNGNEKRFQNMLNVSYCIFGIDEYEDSWTITVAQSLRNQRLFSYDINKSGPFFQLYDFYEYSEFKIRMGIHVPDFKSFLSCVYLHLVPVTQNWWAMKALESRLKPIKKPVVYKHLKNSEILDAPIVEILKRKLLSVRACNCLKRMDIQRLRDLDSKPKLYAGQTYDFGDITCDEVIRFAQSKGIRFSN
ncbi:MAG: hypothetical protein ACI88L_000394 [Candidatus Paceibacteria bacterium]|jgi:hypothetical protein